MAKAEKGITETLITELRANFARLMEQSRAATISERDKRKLNSEISRLSAELTALTVDLDPIRRPNIVFDPGNPRTVGFFIALAMTTQERQPLGNLGAFYGGGLYALYYNGGFAPYAPIRGTETPIYVGMALRGTEEVAGMVGQGTPLSNRLNEHKKNIFRAHETLSVEDFEYRALVLQSGWESTAESYLIGLFKPIWNKESKILFGFGKHGDLAKTRMNRRSPWDTLHTGRSWAGDSVLTDNKSPEMIKALLKSHFGKNRVFKSFAEILEQFELSLRQR